MNAIVLLGPPGAGKGTIAQELTKSGYTHVSTGDLLRESARQGSEVGLLAQGFMERGELAPDRIVIDIIKELLSKASPDQKFMFDGFPRTLVQAELLTELVDRLGVELDKVILLDCADNVIIARLTGRRVCRECGAVYHVEHMPPAVEGVCDVDQGELYQRADDNEETVQNRLSVYAEQTAPLVAYYADKGIIFRVDATAGIQDCLGAVLEALR